MSDAETYLNSVLSAYEQLAHDYLDAPAGLSTRSARVNALKNNLGSISFDGFSIATSQDGSAVFPAAEVASLRERAFEYLRSDLVASTEIQRVTLIKNKLKDASLGSFTIEASDPYGCQAGTTCRGGVCVDNGSAPGFEWNDLAGPVPLLPELV